MQTVIPRNGDEPERIYCPRYIALATSSNASLDSQLQIAGRSFVELKGVSAPKGWEIQLLGVKNMAERLKQYSQMERHLADINNRGGSKLRLFEALKKGTATLVAGELGSPAWSACEMASLRLFWG